MKDNVSSAWKKDERHQTYEQDFHPRQDKNRPEAQPLRHDSSCCRPYAHPSVDGQGIPSVGPTKMRCRSDIGDIRHHGGTKHPQADAKQKMNRHQLGGGAAEGEQKTRACCKRQARDGQQLASQPVRDQAQGQRNGSRHEQKGSVDDTNLKGIGA